MSEAKDINTIAIRRLLDVDESVPPETCWGCPLGERVEPFHEVMNDLEEAHYRCALLRRTVWGESPECNLLAWRTAASGEVVT